MIQIQIAARGGMCLSLNEETAVTASFIVLKIIYSKLKIIGGEQKYKFILKC